MTSTQLINAIKKEKLDVIDDVSRFLKNKLDDFDEVSKLLDEFRNTFSIKNKKKKTFYNHFIAKQMIQINNEQQNLPEDNDDYIPKNMRMKAAAAEWKNYKETTNYHKDKTQFEEDQNSEISSDDESIKKKSKSKKNKKSNDSDTE
jgi:hypothetical protein